VSETWSDQPLAPAPGTDVCAVDEIPDGGARVFEFGRGFRPFELLVVRDGEALHGYVNQCAHMAIPLNMLPVVQTLRAHLLCDHHYARFRFRDGYCVEGPCEGDRLMGVPLEIADGRIRIGPRSAAA
jgi:nitrite reductase/ring-hydroxylating ferredoxin subunit